MKIMKPATLPIHFPPSSTPWSLKHPIDGTNEACPDLPPSKHRSIVSDGWGEHAFDPKGAYQPGIDKLSEDDLAKLHSILRKARKALPTP